MPKETIELLKKGRDANMQDKYRQGNVIHLPADAGCLITGDLHGHRRNFERIFTYADLGHNPNRHVILQEIIHGGPEDREGGCLSYKLLFDVVRYKLRFPDRVHIIMGNHDTAFINNSQVMKNGKEMNCAMREALDREFGKSSEHVKLAIKQFLFAQPLAVRCPNRIFVAHSLPADRYLKRFDYRILEQALRVHDVVKPGSVYLLTWGRSHSQELLNEMAETLDIDLFILGHQSQEKGCCRAGHNLLILATDHEHGCILPIDLSKSCRIEDLMDKIIPIASIA